MRSSPHFLKYLHPEIFPAQRDTLISAAIKAGAPDEVLETLGAVDCQEEFTLPLPGPGFGLAFDERIPVTSPRPPSKTTSEQP